MLTTIEVVIGAIAGGLLTSGVSKWKERKTISKQLEELQKQINGMQNEFREELAIVRSELMLEISGLKKAESASLKNTIRSACKNAIHQNYIPLDEKQDILDCYYAYEDIVAKNGVIDDAVASMRELPNEVPQY